MKKAAKVLLNMPPDMPDIKIYFNQKGMPEVEAKAFYEYYSRRHWISKKGNFFRDWKNIAYRWIASVIRKKPELFNRAIH